MSWKYYKKYSARLMVSAILSTLELSVQKLVAKNVIMDILRIVGTQTTAEEVAVCKSMQNIQTIKERVWIIGLNSKEKWTSSKTVSMQ